MKLAKMGVVDGANHSPMPSPPTPALSPNDDTTGDERLSLKRRRVEDREDGGNMTSLVSARPDIRELQVESYEHLQQLAEYATDLNDMQSLIACTCSVMTVPDQLWGKIRHLVSLDLSVNQIEEVPWALGSLNDLRHLDLSSNRLTTLPGDLFARLHGLETLFLSRNQLADIPQSIQSCTQLSSLDVSGNRLTHLPLQMAKLRRLTELGVRDNPWEFPFREVFAAVFPEHQPASNKRMSYLGNQLMNRFSKAQNRRSIAVGELARQPRPEEAAALRRRTVHIDSSRIRRPKSAVLLATQSGDEDPSRAHTPIDGQPYPTETPAVHANRIKWLLNYMLDVYTLDQLAKLGWSSFDMQDIGMPVDMSEEAEDADDVDVRTLAKQNYDTMKQKKMEQTRPNVVREMLETERVYVRFLQTVNDLYILPLIQSGIVSAEEIATVFSNWEALLKFHRDTLLPDLLTADRNPNASLGQVFLQHSDSIKQYILYVNNFDAALTEYQRLMKKKAKFQRFCVDVRKNPAHSQPNLEFFLIMPVQRIPRYVLLLQDLLKNTTEKHADFEKLKAALAEMKRRAAEINEQKRIKLMEEQTDALQHRIRGDFSTPLSQTAQIGGVKRLLKHSGLLEVGWYCKRSVKSGSRRGYLKTVPVNKTSLFVLFDDFLLQCKSSDGFAGQESFNLEAELRKPVASSWILTRVIRWPKQSMLTPASPQSPPADGDDGPAADLPATAAANFQRRVIIEKKYLMGRADLGLRAKTSATSTDDAPVIDEGRWALRLLDDDRVLYMWPPGPRLPQDASPEQLETLDTWYKLIATTSVDNGN